MKSKIGVVILASIFAATFGAGGLIGVVGLYAVSLLCEEVDTREGTSYLTVWKQERVMQVNGMQAAISFSPPAHVPPSQPHTDIYHRWRVLLCFPDAKDERGFDLVIDPARKA